jgi:hypothetical protein
LNVKLSTQFAIVVCTAILGLFSMVVCLAIWADWSDGAVVGMVAGIGSALVAVATAVRGQQKTGEAVAALDRKSDVIVAQTNGLSEIERQDIAQRAAVTAIAEYEKHHKGR